MMNKKVFLIIGCIALLLITSSLVLAANDNNGNTMHKLESNSIKNASEKTEVAAETEKLKNKLNSKKIDTLDENGNESLIEVTADTVSVDYDKSYKTYMLNVSDIVKAYGDNANFSDCISENYIWEAPLCDKEKNIVSTAAFRKGENVENIKQKQLKFKNQKTESEFYERAKQREGKWYWVRTGNMIPCAEVEFVSNNEKIANFLNDSGIGEPDEIKYVSLEQYRTDIIFVRVGTEEYGITFGMRPDLTGLQNRTIYPISEIIHTLDKSFNLK